MTPLTSTLAIAGAATLTAISLMMALTAFAGFHLATATSPDNGIITVSSLTAAAALTAAITSAGAVVICLIYAVLYVKDLRLRRRARTP